MNILQNVSLAAYSGMAVGGSAAYLTEASTRADVREAFAWAEGQQLPIIMIGSGSNIVWRDEGFQGLVIVDRILHYEQFDEDETNTYLTIGSGEPWDSVVERSVQAGLTGIEALSLIPGTAGATPVQNVGAYGQEIANVITTIEAFDTEVKDFVTLASDDCGFSYRHSRFNTTDRGRFYITGVTLHLTKGKPVAPFYSAVQAYFQEHAITDVTPAIMRQAVVAIRSAKLPDYTQVHNNGSFFANPIVSAEEFSYLTANFEAIPHWLNDDGSVKISAAWLIEQAGFKDFHDPETGMATWPTQPLVLVNEHAKNTADVLAFKQKIVDSVHSKFNITLQQEPELLPNLSELTS